MIYESVMKPVPCRSLENREDISGRRPTRSKDARERRKMLGCNNACRIKEGELHLVKMSDTVNRASTITCSFRAPRAVNDRLKHHISKSSLPPAGFSSIFIPVYRPYFKWSWSIVNVCCATEINLIEIRFYKSRGTDRLSKFCELLSLVSI